MVNSIGKRIRDFRERAGVSQKKLGMSLGLSDKAVSAYESGRTLPPVETLYRISQELNKPLRLFLSDDEEELTVDERLDAMEKSIRVLLTEIEKLRKEFNG